MANGPLHRVLPPARVIRIRTGHRLRLLFTLFMHPSHQVPCVNHVDSYIWGVGPVAELSTQTNITTLQTKSIKVDALESARSHVGSLAPFPSRPSTPRRYSTHKIQASATRLQASEMRSEIYHLSRQSPLCPPPSFPLKVYRTTMRPRRMRAKASHQCILCPPRQAYTQCKPPWHH